MPGQGLHRVAVAGRRVQEPALPLGTAAHLLQLAEVGADRLHPVAEALDLTEQGRVLQVLENLLAVPNGVGIAQVPEQRRRDEGMLLAITRDRRDNLVEV